MNVLSVQSDFAFISYIDAGQNLAQGALAGPILTHKRVTTAALDVKAHVVESQDAGKAFGDRMERKEGHGAHQFTSTGCRSAKLQPPGSREVPGSKPKPLKVVSVYRRQHSADISNGAFHSRHRIIRKGFVLQGDMKAVFYAN